MSEISCSGGGFRRRAFCGFDNSAIDSGYADGRLILLSASGEESGLSETVDRHDGAFESFGSCYAATIDKFGFVTKLFGKFGGLGSATVNENNVNAEMVEDGDLLDEIGEVGGLFDCLAAALDDKYFASVMFEVRKSVAEGLDGGIFHVI